MIYRNGMNPYSLYHMPWVGDYERHGEVVDTTELEAEIPGLNEEDFISSKHPS